MIQPTPSVKCNGVPMYHLSLGIHMCECALKNKTKNIICILAKSYKNGIKIFLVSFFYVLFLYDLARKQIIFLFCFSRHIRTYT